MRTKLQVRAQIEGSGRSALACTSKIPDIFEGTQQIQQLIVARRLLGKTSGELKYACPQGFTKARVLDQCGLDGQALWGEVERGRSCSRVGYGSSALSLRRRSIPSAAARSGGTSFPASARTVCMTIPSAAAAVPLESRIGTATENEPSVISVVRFAKESGCSNATAWSTVPGTEAPP